MQDYDNIPYDSVPVANAHPYKFAAFARLLGLHPPEPAQARILEVGCAEGGTLIPLARLWPESDCVGLELSPLQVRAGKQMIQALGLSNIRIEQADILQVDQKYGSFDYIIAHGVFSWVPEAVQEKLLCLCRELLSPYGIAYVSYNINPGWRLRGALRDMLLVHTRAENSALAKLQSAYVFCDKLALGLGKANTPIANYLRQEIKDIKQARKSYVFHEYLEEVNSPLLFSEFLARARAQQLAYVCDTDFYTLFPESFGVDAEGFLQACPDVQSTEQYIDFLRMRTFRQSLLCHAQHTPNYNIDLSKLDTFALYSDLYLEGKIKLDTDRPVQFKTTQGVSIAASQPLVKVILQHLQQVYPNAILVSELIEMANTKLLAANSPHANASRSAAYGEIFNLLANNIIGVATQAKYFPECAGRVNIRATRFAQLQTERADGYLTSCWSQIVGLDDFSTRLLRLLDGSRDIEQITSQLYEEEKKSNKKASRDNVLANVHRLILLFSKHGILEPNH